MAITVKNSEQLSRRMVENRRIKSGTRREKFTKTTTTAQDNLTKSNAKPLFFFRCGKKKFLLETP